MSYSVEVGYTVAYADGGELVSATSAEGVRGKAAAKREGERIARELRDECAKFGHRLSVDYVRVIRDETRRELRGDSEDGDSLSVAASVPVSRGMIRENRTRRAMLRAMIAAGYLPQPGRCDCSHCANDWDCCGRLFPSRVTLRSVNRREAFATAVVHYVRNV